MKSMNFSLGEASRIRLALDANQTASTREARGLALECTRGSVWITFENGGEDYVLNPGERLPINAGGRLVIQGLVPSEIAFVRIAETKQTLDMPARLLQHPGECLRNFVTSLAASRVNIDSPV